MASGSRTGSNGEPEPRYRMPPEMVEAIGEAVARWRSLQAVSDQAQGPGWWQASDDLWYPPESHPEYRPPPPPPPSSPPAPPRAGQEPVVAKGVNGTVVFDGQAVTIQRTGALARMTVGKGEKRIPVKSITAVQWKPATAMIRGFIQFTVPGGNEGRSKVGRQTRDAARDENSVLFGYTQREEFERLRAAIEAAL